MVATLLDRFAARLGYQRPEPGPAKGLRIESTGPLASFEEASLLRYDEGFGESLGDSYRKLSWVHAAISSVAKTGASAALRVAKVDAKGDEKELPNHPLIERLRSPNPLMSRYELLVATLSYYQLTGNAYWWLNRANERAEPAEIWLIPAEHIKPIPDGRLGLRGYKYDTGVGEAEALEPWEVVHFKTFNPANRYLGLSPLESLSDSVATDLAMQRWNRNYFSKENAKVPGALAFSDPIDDATWQKMKREIREEYAGTKRSLMMLRNVGKGGVEWVSMALSQKDMEFLASRVANREEIFGLYAPGLASMLAVNATEANALAGRRTFAELAVWPALTVLAEKLTNSLLPLWGEGLVARFEDIRPTDRALRIAEQGAAAVVLTIDELRERFFELEPLGDDRGNLLPAQVSANLTIGIEEPEPEPIPPALLAAAIAPPEPEPAGPQDGAAEPGQGEPGQAEEAPAAAAAKAAEVKQFRRWLKKKPGRDIDGFSALFLGEAEKRAIAEAETQLGSAIPGAAENDGVGPHLGAQGRIGTEAATERRPFSLGKATHKRGLPFANGADKEREVLEKKHAPLLAEALRKLLRKVIPDASVEGKDAKLLELLEENKGLLRDAVYRMLFEAAMLGVEAGRYQIEGGAAPAKVEGTVSTTAWDLPNTAVIHWLTGGGQGLVSGGYASELTTQLIRSTAEAARPLVANWMGDGTPLSSLMTQLEATGFSAQRAELIATTEVTRAYAEGNVEAWRASGSVDGKRWETVADEAVCPICGALNGQERGLNEDFQGPNGAIRNPPAHPRCRCNVSPVLIQTQRLAPKPEPTAGQAAAPAPALAPAGKPQTAAEARAKVLDRYVVQKAERAVRAGEEQTLRDGLADLRGQKRHTSWRIGEAKRRGDPAEDIAQLEAEYQSLMAQENVNYRRLAELAKELEAFDMQAAAELRAIVAVDNPAQFTGKFAVKPSKKEIRAIWEEGERGFAELVDDSLLSSSNREVEYIRKAKRANYNLTGGVDMADANAKPRTVVHELGHWLEDANPDVHDKALAFYDRRTAGEALEHLGPGYRSNERGRKDKFFSAYIGKEYKSGGRRYATEVVSMGLEYMYREPGYLASADADMFDFIWHLARGL